MENSNLYIHPHLIGQAERTNLKNHLPACLWFTGLSGSGKSSIANLVEKRLNQEFRAHTYLLDGDAIRHGLNTDLDFSIKDRSENIRRVGEVARLFVDAGLIVITAFISPLRIDRARTRHIFKTGFFVEIFVDCPLEICEQRDPKGLYKKAREGILLDFTGINSPYEPPDKPELTLFSGNESVSENAGKVIDYLRKKGILGKDV